MIARLVNVLALGFVLSLDNFRTSLLLGPLRMSRPRTVLVALNFGLWDGLAPLLGLLIGDYVGNAIGPISDDIGPLVLLAYGAYLLIRAWREPAGAADDEFAQSWTLFGLPLPLSIDNIVAGTSLGLLGVSPWLPALIFGVTTAVMSLVGLVLGRLAFRLVFSRVNIRYEIVTGTALIIEAAVLFFLAGRGN
ncbi:manganese efflux pump MntP family protein [Actinomycetospora chiangmaiensis]|uniref:manganese efflux pump MntP n=1 Tax=Actinomycetospora chiangmaiensis TaxID=402650 RepID=UPI0003824D8A|nr:manganese efflux pump [Actinomycetospora chiangmaiensis]